MRNNPVQFAVVREDPLIEASVLWDIPQAKQVLLVASGGCNALSLRSLLPEIEWTLIDVNPAQLELVQSKLNLMGNTKTAEFKTNFNIEDSRSSGLNASGNFESLFRGLREFVFEFVLPYGEMRRLFEKENIAEASRERIFSNKFWPVGFEMYFCDGILKAMFGEKALQNPPHGSYPLHFRKVLESGFQRVDARNNYFLHHIFLGHYLDRDAALPIYLSKGFQGKKSPAKSTTKVRDEKHIKFHLGQIQSLRDEVKNFDLISLSNIFDWINESEVAEIGALLGQQMKPGARLIFRQLNASTSFNQYFADQFEFNTAKAAELLSKDRSLFYSKLNIAVKK